MESIAVGGGSAVLLVLLEYAGAGSAPASSMQGIVALLLTVAVGMRFSATGKVFPAGVVALLSIAMAYVYISRWYQLGPKPHAD